MIKFDVLITIDRSGHGKAFLVCRSTGRRTGGFPMSPVRFPTPVDMAEKALAWAHSRANVPAAQVSHDVRVDLAR